MSEALALVPKATAQQSMKDFKSDQEVRWCPGCGDYAILAAVQSFMPELACARENVAFVSGIGCSSPLPVLHEHLRHALHPRPRAGHRHRARLLPQGPERVGGDRRRRRAVDRRQPPDPRPAAERQPEDPAVQQPDLRPDQGPVQPDLRDRQDHQVDADGLARRALQPAVAGDRRRGVLRGPHHRLRPQAHPERAARGRRPPGHRAGGDLPELQHLQRRRLRHPQGPGHRAGRPDPRRSTGTRSGSARRSAPSGAATGSAPRASYATRPPATCGSWT